jgi:hypothetical protein
MRVSTVVEDVSPFLPGDTIAVLRIADSDRRFPFRPVSSGMFLIGHGPSCDLRLGMSDVPSIHSVIQLDAKSAEITQISSQPELLINGEPVKRSPLHDGDLIEIGDVRMAFHLCHPSVDSILEDTSLTELASSSDIIAKLESELALLEPADSYRERMQELLKAAQLSIENRQFAETLRFADYAAKHSEAPHSSDEEVREQILAKLHAHENRLDEICHVLEHVVQQQQLIAASLQCIVERLEDLKTVSQPGTLRASA